MEGENDFTPSSCRHFWFSNQFCAFVQHVPIMCHGDALVHAQASKNIHTDIRTSNDIRTNAHASNDTSLSN